MRLAWVLLIVAACRIGFDEVAPDGGQLPSNIVCTPGTLCIVDCAGREPCDVACNGAAQCVVDCAGHACSVSGCSGAPACIVDCGTDASPTVNGQRATCP